MSKNNFKIETLNVHGGYERDSTNAITLPIYQTTAYEFNDADHGANLFDLKEFGNIYSRLTNPTWDALGTKINTLEGGAGTLVTSSGSAAITLAILNVASAGDHIVSVQNIYGGSYSLFKNTLKKFGIEVTFVDQYTSLDELKKSIKENTKAIFGETIGNPKGSVLDFEKFSALSKFADVPLIVDNTFATPYLFRPFEHGANIIVHSATKYLGGHGNALGGAIVDGGNFNWDNGKFPGLIEPNEAYHGVKFWETFGNIAYIIKARVELIRDIGATLSPFNAFLIHNGIETLHLRLDRISQNALELAEWLENHPKVEWVSYPLLKSHPDYDLSKKYFTKGASGILSFGVKGGLEESKNFINNLELLIHGANLGDNRTIISHPGSTTHRQLSIEAQLKSGITPNLIRISIGIENLEDIKEDINQSLEKI